MKRSQVKSAANQRTEAETRKIALLALPGSLVRHVLSFLESHSLARMLSCCSMRSTGFNMHESQLDQLWRQRYFHEFEAESAASPKIAIDGTETNWRMRFVRRMQTEQNWSAGRSRKKHLSSMKGVHVWTMLLHDDHIVIGDVSGTVHILDSNGGVVTTINTQERGAVCGLALTKRLDPPTLVTHASKGAVKVWNFATQQLRCEIDCASAPSTAVHENWLLVGEAHSLRFYDLRDCKLVRTTPLQRASTGACAESFDIHWPSQRVLVGDSTHVRLLDAQSGTVLGQLSSSVVCAPSNALFTVDGASAVCAFDSGEVMLWRFSNGTTQTLLNEKVGMFTPLARHLKNQFVVGREFSVVLLQQPLGQSEPIEVCSVVPLRISCQWDRLLVNRHGLAVPILYDFTPEKPEKCATV